MAGPKFSTPPGVAPSTVKRWFTLQQANKSLPLVSRIVRDIVQAHGTATRLQEQIQGGNARRGEEAELEATLERLQELVEELSEVGCELKDYEMGLVDFIGRHEGREVCLCWKLDEGKIGYWHELNAGYAGRKPVSQLREDPA